jgi:uncharacterized Fe-S cluster-containing radical SAM superfamily enzyme
MVEVVLVPGIVPVEHLGGLDRLPLEGSDLSQQKLDLVSGDDIALSKVLDLVELIFEVGKEVAQRPLWVVDVKANFISAEVVGELGEQILVYHFEGLRIRPLLR